MKLFIIIFAVSSFQYSHAGLFCGDLNCDLDVNKYSHEVMRTEKIEQMEKFKYGSFSSADHAGALLSIGRDLKEKPWNLMHNEKNSFKQNSGYDFKNCAMTVYQHDKAKSSGEITFTMKCDKVFYKIKTNKELQQDVCQKAIQCSKKVENLEQAKKYRKLVDEMCRNDVDKNIVNPTFIPEVNDSREIKETSLPASEKTYSSPATSGLK